MLTVFPFYWREHWGLLNLIACPRFTQLDDVRARLQIQFWFPHHGNSTLGGASPSLQGDSFSMSGDSFASHSQTLGGWGLLSHYKMAKMSIVSSLKRPVREHILRQYVKLSSIHRFSVLLEHFHGENICFLSILFSGSSDNEKSPFYFELEDLFPWRFCLLASWKAR